MEKMESPSFDGFEVSENGKHKITQLIEKRNKDRQVNLENINEAKLRTHEATENLDYFHDTFNAQARDIQLNLANMDTPDKATLAVRFDKIAKNVQQLQSYLSSSTLFLPDSVIQRNQRTITDLITELDAVKAKLLPKKKFGFRSAKTAPPPTGAVLPSPIDAEATKPNSLLLPIEWTIKDKLNQEILLEDTEVNGKDLTMTSLTNCLIRIVGHPGSLQLSNVHNCLVLSGPVARSVFIDNCTKSTLAFGCQQFRLHSSNDLAVCMHVTCRAIIEDCTDIRVAPFTFAYAGIELDFVKADLDVSKNNWRDVADFNWLSADKASPNWRELNEAETIGGDDWALVTEEFRRANVNKEV